MVRGVKEDGPHPVDRHVGRRVSEKRISLGYNQSDLGRALGLTFQQIQKYEKGANRISAARLWQLSEALETPVSYFYDGLAEALEQQTTARPERSDMFSRKETMDLIQAYYQLDERPRRRRLDLAKSLHADGGEPM